VTIEVAWRLFVRAKRETNARRVLQRVTAALGLPAQEVSVERYWKDPEQYVLRFSTPLDAATPADAVFKTILAAGQIGSGWNVSLQSSANGSWEFIMLKPNGHFSISGVEFGHVDLQVKP
jgi:hypothetical protein